MSKREACCDCRYWETTFKTGWGLCKRRAPVAVYAEVLIPVMSYYPTWPLVSKGNWCGEFKEKSSE